MDSWQRLEAVIKWAESSTHKFALQIGLKRSENLYQIKKGNNGISLKLAQRITDRYPQINLAWLMMGEGEMLSQPQKRKPKIESFQKVPLFHGNPADSEIFKQTPHSYVDTKYMAGCELAIKMNRSIKSETIPQDALIFLIREGKGHIDYGHTYLVTLAHSSIIAIIRRGKEGYINLQISPKEEIVPMELALSEVESIFLIRGYCVLL